MTKAHDKHTVSTPKPDTRQHTRQLLKWFAKHGRKTLPWQHGITPYRVWVSEIMLQQTQVETVIPYFERFMTHFPNVVALGHSHIDDVLRHWSGLGYYARGRNLHRSAQTIIDEHNGELPKGVAALEKLPGIGRSTAGAIAAISQGIRAPILDGNVKRVLARMYCVEGWPGETRTQRQLWSLAEQHTPKTKFADYTQAIMDLGATICTRARPNCAACPWHNGCKAYASGQTAQYPTSKPRKKLPTRRAFMLIMERPNGAVLLEKRPAEGIWGGLFSFPEYKTQAALQKAIRTDFGLTQFTSEKLTSFKHSFTHFHLDIVPVRVSIQDAALSPAAQDGLIWHAHANAEAPGLPAPVKTILKQLQQCADV